MIETKIQILRQLRGFSQQYMSSRLGIRQDEYSRIENGNRKQFADDPLLKRAAEILGVPVNDLLHHSPLIVQTSDVFSSSTLLEAKEKEIRELKEQLAKKEGQLEKLLELLYASGVVVGGGDHDLINNELS